MKSFDHSVFRAHAACHARPITDLILALMRRAYGSLPPTLLAVCPTSDNAVCGTVRAAKRQGVPLIFAATLNQVDLDGGYTGWTQADFVRCVAGHVQHEDYAGPVVIGLDHAGPGLKDSAPSGLDRDHEMEMLRRSIAESVAQGYDLVYLDPTGPWRHRPRSADFFDSLVSLTIEMISIVESARSSQQPPPLISYELGSEDSGHISAEIFLARFLSLLRPSLKREGLGHVWPTFAVGDVGTRLHTSTFDAASAFSLAAAAIRYQTSLKAHNTDWVAHPEQLPLAGVACANLGPEVADAEFSALKALEHKERELCKSAALSHMEATVRSAVVASGRWQKWQLPTEHGAAFEHLTNTRQDWLIRSGSRYVWTEPSVANARACLYSNLARAGIDADTNVTESISQLVQRYCSAFALTGSLERIDAALASM